MPATASTIFLYPVMWGTELFGFKFNNSGSAFTTVPFTWEFVGTMTSTTVMAFSTRASLTTTEVNGVSQNYNHRSANTVAPSNNVSMQIYTIGSNVANYIGVYTGYCERI